jgi:hypothetical protein
VIKRILVSITFIIFLYSEIIGRSIHRTPDPLMPCISVTWDQDPTTYTLRNYNLQEYPLFTLFDKDFFDTHQLPSDGITYRRSEKKIDGAILKKYMHELVQEINQKKRAYAHFTILQDKGYNYHRNCGLLVLKFKEYPFVVKLFMENPKSFVNPWAKGFEPIFFFYMGGGANRHLSGFTRLKNLAYIKHKIANNPDWSTCVDVPRKWFWHPERAPWLAITGKHIGTKSDQFISLPSVYAIVADAIEPQRTFSSFNRQDMSTALSLSNFLEANLDLHITNFMIEQGSGKIIIIDTEHFPTMVGLKEKTIFDSYIAWYAQLIGKCVKDMLFCTKKERRLAQQTNERYPVPSFLNDQQNQPVHPHTVQSC